MNLKVNAWTQWGRLKTVVVGTAQGSCYFPEEPGFRGKINDSLLKKEIDWPRGPKTRKAIDNANRELENLAMILTSLGVKVLRPEPMQLDKEIVTPSWQIRSMGCITCPRDVMITIGNFMLEATMSKRSRFFEYLPYRKIIHSYWHQDRNMKWKAAPKPSMNDEMYWQGYWSKFDGFETLAPDEQERILHSYKFILNENEPAFDAADITRCGKDIFVQNSMTTNMAGIDWLSRELEGHVRVHPLHFPYDREPSHIDCTFIPLRPPTDRSPGIILTNPERPLDHRERSLFVNNSWSLIDAPMPQTPQMPPFCQSSKWLSMNILSLDERTLVVEEGELELHKLLAGLGFELVKIPFRAVYEFGGSIHCSTWDIEREDSDDCFFSKAP